MTLLFIYLAILGACGLFGLLAFWTEPLWALPGLERLTPNIVYRVGTRQPLVALSFDDGPHPSFTPQVLDILQGHSARATFFLIGDRALRHPEVVAAIRSAGHEIGNLYSSNVSTLSHSDVGFVSNLEQTEAILGLTTKPALFRPPGGVAWPRQIKLAQLARAAILAPRLRLPARSHASAGLVHPLGGREESRTGSDCHPPRRHLRSFAQHSGLAAHPRSWPPQGPALRVHL